MAEKNKDKAFLDLVKAKESNFDNAHLIMIEKKAFEDATKAVELSRQDKVRIARKSVKLAKRMVYTPAEIAFI